MFNVFCKSEGGVKGVLCKCKCKLVKWGFDV